MTTSVRSDARIRYDDRGSVAVLFCFIVLLACTLVTALVDAGTAIQAADRAATDSAEGPLAASIAAAPVPSRDAADAPPATRAVRECRDQGGATGT